MPPGARAEAPANVQDEELFRQPGAESFTGDALEERRAILDAEEIAGRTLKTEEQQIILNRYTGESQATRFVEAETDRLRRESGDDTLELTEEQKQDVYQRYFASEIRNDMEEERRQLGRELTEEEKEDIIYHYFENDAFNQIDEFTNEILERYQDEFKPAPTGRLERFVNFFKKPAVKRAVVTAAASIVIRTLIHLTPLSPIAGTLTGFAIGGWRGYQRGKETTEKEMFSLSGVTAEYQRILRETDAPHARANALSFLQNILETGDFKGNAGDLLKLLVMYRAEAGRVENLDIASLSHMGKLQREEFDESVKKAAKEAGIAGMKKGMLKGALIGAGTDLIAFGWHWLNTEHLKHEYITQHYGAQHEIRTTDGPDLRTDHLTPDTSHNPIFDHMDRYTTEYATI